MFSNAARVFTCNEISGRAAWEGPRSLFLVLNCESELITAVLVYKTPLPSSAAFQGRFSATLNKSPLPAKRLPGLAVSRQPRFPLLARGPPAPPRRKNAVSDELSKRRTKTS